MSVTKISHFFWALALTFFSFFFFTRQTLFAQNSPVFTLQSASSDYTVEDQINLNLQINTADETVNTITVHLQYPTDKLSFVESNFTQSDFPGIVEREETNPGFLMYTLFTVPGYQGSAGRLLNLQFKAKASGEALIIFLPSSAIYSADGNGLDIKGDSPSFTFNISSTVQPPDQTKPGLADTIKSPLAKVGEYLSDRQIISSHIVDYTQTGVDPNKVPSSSESSSFFRNINPLFLLLLFVLVLSLIVTIFIFTIRKIKK